MHDVPKEGGGGRITTSQSQYAHSPSKLNWNANETETHCAAKQTTFRAFPLQVFAAAYLRGCFKCPDIYGSSPNRGRSSPLFRPRADCGCGWDGIKTRCTRVSWRRIYAPPLLLPSHVHPIKQFSKKAELAASTCTTMDKTSHLRVCFLVLSKRPLYLLARLVFSVLGDEFRQDRTSSGCSAVHCGTCSRTPIICSSLAFFLQTVPTNGLTQSGFTVNLKRWI